MQALKLAVNRSFFRGYYKLGARRIVNGPKTTCQKHFSTITSHRHSKYLKPICHLNHISSKSIFNCSTNPNATTTTSTRTTTGASVFFIAINRHSHRTVIGVPDTKNSNNPTAASNTGDKDGSDAAAAAATKKEVPTITAKSLQDPEVTGLCLDAPVNLGSTALLTPFALREITTSKLELTRKYNLTLRDLRVIFDETKKAKSQRYYEEQMRLKSLGSGIISPDTKRNTVIDDSGISDSSSSSSGSGSSGSKDSKSKMDGKGVSIDETIASASSVLNKKVNNGGILEDRTKYNAPAFFIRSDCYIAHLCDITALVTPTHCYIFNHPKISVIDRFLAKFNQISHPIMSQFHLQMKLSETQQLFNENSQTKTVTKKDKIPKTEKEERDSKTDDSNSNGNSNGNTTQDLSSEDITAIKNENSKTVEDLIEKANEFENDENKIPFEISCLESILKASVTTQRDICDKYRIATDNIVSTLRSKDKFKSNYSQLYSDSLLYSDNYGMNITSIKLDLAKSISLIQSLRDAINTLLNNDYDMSQMNLTYKYINNFNKIPPISMHDEIELILENYLWQYEEILHDLKLFMEELNMHEKAIGLILNKQRNQIMRINLKLTVLTVGFSCSAMCASIFGMNLLSTLETDPYAFWVAASMISVVMPFGIWRYFRYHMNYHRIFL